MPHLCMTLCECRYAIPAAMSTATCLPCRRQLSESAASPDSAARRSPPCRGGGWQRWMAGSWCGSGAGRRALVPTGERRGSSMRVACTPLSRKYRWHRRTPHFQQLHNDNQLLVHHACAVPCDHLQGLWGCNGGAWRQRSAGTQTGGRRSWPSLIMAHRALKLIPAPCLGDAVRRGTGPQERAAPSCSHRPTRLRGVGQALHHGRLLQKRVDVACTHSEKGTDVGGRTVVPLGRGEGSGQAGEMNAPPHAP